MNVLVCETLLTLPVTRKSTERFHKITLKRMNIKFKGSFKAKAIAIATAVTITGAAAFMPLVASADLISDLQAQIAALQAQLLALSAGTPAASSSACSFTKDLTVGSRGDDVKCLQESLISAGHLAAGLNTAYFGNLTKAAVSKWQASAGVSPTAGYFGSKSRAAYGAMAPVASVPAAGTPAAGTPAVVVPAGSGLSVSGVADQPASTLAPANAARLPFTKVVFTASGDGDVMVKSITVERQGLADDVAFDGIILLDENGIQVGLAKTLNALHRALLNQSFTVKAGTSRTMLIAANMGTPLTNQAGQVAKLAVVAVDAGSTVVSGLSSAIVGNGQTINSTLSIGTLTSGTRGVLDPGAARAALEVGVKDFYASAVRFTVGSNEPISVKQVRWYQAGSAGASDLTNVKAVVKGVSYDTVLSDDGKYYTATLGSGIDFDKGAAVELAVKTDVTSGSDRTINFDLQRRVDVVAIGKTYGYYLTAANGSSAAAADSGNLSSSEPFYDSFKHTISKGTLRAEKSNSVAAGNVPVDVTDASLGAFAFEAKGENAQVSNFVLNFTFTGTGTSSNVTNVSLYDSTGAIVAGPKDPASGIVTWTDSWTIPVGLKTYTVKGKLSTTFVTDDKVTVSTLPANMTVKGETTGLTITATPGLVSGNTQTVKGASLTVNVSQTPAAQNVVRGVNGFTFANYQFDASASGEDVRVTSAVFRDVLDAAGSGNEVNTCQLFDGTLALNTGNNVANPTDPSGTTNDVTFTLDNHLIVPKGTTKVVTLKCNILAAAGSATTHQWGLVNTAGNIVSTGKDTGVAITEVMTAASGQTMTIQTGGTLTITHDVSSPGERFGIAGKTDIMLAVLKLEAKHEAVTMNQLALTLASSTASTSDISKVTLWDGATQVGSAIFSGTNTRATSTFTGTFTVPKDSIKLLTVKGDLASLGLNQPATRGHLITVNYDGDATTTTKGTGESSGTTVNPATGGDSAATGVRLVRSYPTLERMAVQSNTLSDGEMTMYQFKITADAAGDVGLAKMSFKVSSTTAATTSAIKLFAYADSSLSVPAYATNPIHSRNVANLNQTTWGTQAGTIATPLAVFFFNPVTTTNPANTSSTSEAVNIPAGATRYFVLRGSVTNSKAGDSINVALQGDAAVVSNTNLVGRQTADAVAGGAITDMDFIWSPNTTTTSATTTNDWTNGYLVPGLPTTEMTQQTFSK